MFSSWCQGRHMANLHYVRFNHFSLACCLHMTKSFFNNVSWQSLAAAVKCWFFFTFITKVAYVFDNVIKLHEWISQITLGMFNRNILPNHSHHVRPLQNHCLLPPCFSQTQAITDTFDVITRPTEGVCEPDSRRWMIAFIKWTSDASTFPSIINKLCNRTPQHTEP